MSLFRTILLACLALVLSALYFGLGYALHPEFGSFGGETFRTSDELVLTAMYLFCATGLSLFALGAAISGSIWGRIREPATSVAVGALLISSIVAWWRISDALFRPL